MKERIVELDFIKGILIVLMVLGHISYIGTFQNIFENIRDYIYTFHMPLFLLISGYLFYPYNALGDYFMKTINRIVKPYMIFLTLYLLLLYFAKKFGVSTSNEISDIGIAEYFSNVFIHPIGAYWFLHVLAIYQIVLIISYKINGQFLMGFLSIFVLIILFLKYFFDIAISLEHITFLIAGTIIRYYNVKITFNVILSILIIVYIWGFYEVDSIKQISLLHLLLVISIYSFLVSIVYYIKNSFFVQLFAYIGTNTLVIFLVSPFLLNIVKLFKNILLSIDHTGILFLIISCMFTVVFSIYLAKKSDMFKSSKLLFGSNKIYQTFQYKK